MENKEHQHKNLNRPMHRNELGLWGINDKSINELYNQLVAHFKKFKIAFYNFSEEHTSNDNYTAITDGGKSLQINHHLTESSTSYFFSAADLLVVNGNYINASEMWLIIDHSSEISLDPQKMALTSKVFYRENEKAKAEELILKYKHLEAIPIISFSDILTLVDRKIVGSRAALNGIVLSGGESKRMKENKSLLVYHNEMQWLHLFKLLSIKCSETFVSCTQENVHLYKQKPVITDKLTGYGPLSGIVSALLSHPEKAWMVVACDLPLLNEFTLNQLIAERDPSKIATAFYNEDSGFLEPLITIYEPKALPIMLNMIAQGYRCPRKILMQNEVKIVSPLQSATLKNINYPEEKAEIIKILGKEN